MRYKFFDDLDLTVGDLIRMGLAEKGIDSGQAAQALRIDESILKMIEAGELELRYPEYLINAIVRDYATFLNLDPLQVRSIYWREVVEKTLNGMDEPNPTPQVHSTGLIGYLCSLLNLGRRP
jgi:cytoskeletal protein RodZ